MEEKEEKVLFIVLLIVVVGSYLFLYFCANWGI